MRGQGVTKPRKNKNPPTNPVKRAPKKNEGPDFWICYLCKGLPIERKSTKQFSVRAHMQKTHPEFIAYVCEICANRKEDPKPKLYQCLESLIKHKKDQHDLDLLECDTCDKELNLVYYVQNSDAAKLGHESEFHKEKFKQKHSGFKRDFFENLQSQQVPRQDARTNCGGKYECGKKFTGKTRDEVITAYDEHRKKKHKKLPPENGRRKLKSHKKQDPTDDADFKAHTMYCTEKYVCPNGKNPIENKKHMEEHLIENHKQLVYSCKECNLEWADLNPTYSKTEWFLHQKKHHIGRIERFDESGNEKPDDEIRKLEEERQKQIKDLFLRCKDYGLNCDHYEPISAKDNQWPIHLQKAHSNVLEECAYCENRFIGLERLWEHYRQHHKDCEKCPIPECPHILYQHGENADRHIANNFQCPPWQNKLLKESAEVSHKKLSELKTIELKNRTVVTSDDGKPILASVEAIEVTDNKFAHFALMAEELFPEGNDLPYKVVHQKPKEKVVFVEDFKKKLERAYIKNKSQMKLYPPSKNGNDPTVDAFIKKKNYSMEEVPEDSSFSLIHEDSEVLESNDDFLKVLGKTLEKVKHEVSKGFATELDVPELWQSLKDGGLKADENANYVLISSNYDEHMNNVGGVFSDPRFVTDFLHSTDPCVDGWNVNWQYVGSGKLEFPIHTEDYLAYSQNTQQFGIKIWWIISAKDKPDVEKLGKKFIEKLSKDKLDKLGIEEGCEHVFKHKILYPGSEFIEVLKNNGITVHTVFTLPGDTILVDKDALHFGKSLTDLTLNQASNFGNSSWMDLAKRKAKFIRKEFEKPNVDHSRPTVQDEDDILPPPSKKPRKSSKKGSKTSKKKVVSKQKEPEVKKAGRKKKDKRLYSLERCYCASMNDERLVRMDPQFFGKGKYLTM